MKLLHIGMVSVLEGLTPRLVDRVVVSPEYLAVPLSPLYFLIFLGLLLQEPLDLLLREEKRFPGKCFPEFDRMGGSLFKQELDLPLHLVLAGACHILMVIAEAETLTEGAENLTPPVAG